MKQVRITGRFALLAVFALAACGDEVAAPDEETLVGNWAVLSVDGQNLPLRQLVSDGEGGSCEITLDGMQLNFARNLRYSGTYDTSMGCNGGAVETAQEKALGDYRTDGDRLFMINDEDPNKREGEMRFTFGSNNRLTLRDYSLGFGTTTFLLERR